MPAIAAQPIVPQHMWPTTLFLVDWPDHARRAPGILRHVRARAERFSKPVESGVATSAKPASGLIESPLDLFRTTDDPDLLALVAWIDACLRTAISGMNGGHVPPEKIGIDFAQSWFHITNEGGFHDAHTHGACSWCGIFYLVAGDAAEVPADGATVAGNGINRFYSPLSLGGIVRDYGNAYLGRSYLDVQPQDGRLVLFPSYLLHSALPYRGSTDRVVFAFNTRSTVLRG